jgi:ABC-type Zn uptake system ZnuABC Zn-binding protein ZnuA
MRSKTSYLVFLLLLSLGTVLNACRAGAAGVEPGSSRELKVVATTTFIGDVVREVAGDKVELVVLLQPGQNPHSYQPTPQDLVALSQADLFFVNGLGLEEFLDELLNGSDTTARVVVVSDGIVPLLGSSEHDHPGSDQSQGSGGNRQPLTPGQDPHVWFDPNNLKVWTDNIAGALSDLDPKDADFYQDNAADYRQQLQELDAWIHQEVETIPLQSRQLVTDHESLAYFAQQYGLTQVGAVIPALTTEAETSGKQLSDLIDTIREHQVKAIFVGIDFDPSLVARVSEETGTRLVPLYFGSLSDGDPAGTYLDFMRYDVQMIVEALR